MIQYDMSVSEIVRIWPETTPVLRNREFPRMWMIRSIRLPLGTH
ncbi:hypothetical protein C8P63_1211 [Melghirimyces profundicolus]|uniref:Uncharacterized protein n=1 Tax=Melghirimyces profundicolus TaxID=1242148 RepID=A0A2T6BGF4_9BACL|nr:hypothetical protein C8P63_1211 [Melghirimyces profundicolus]